MRAWLKTFPLLALVATAAAVPALAQTTSTGAPLVYAQTCDPKTADTQRAIQIFKLGQQFLSEANFDKAIGLFKDAYDTDCTAIELLRWLADAFDRKGDRAEEVRALKEYLRRNPNPADVDTLKRRITNLGGTLETAPTTSTSAPVTATTSAPTATVVPTATATSTGAPTTTATSTATTPTSSPGGGHTIPPWIVTGAGGAALITGGILYVIGAGKVSTADKDCNPNPPGSRQCTNQNAINDGNSGRSLETVGLIVGVVGILGVGGGLVWHFLEPTGPSSPSAGLAPAVGPGYAGVSLGGSF
jgi:hypothetical protein